MRTVVLAIVGTYPLKGNILLVVRQLFPWQAVLVELPAFAFCMTNRDELLRDIEITDRLLEYSGYGHSLRQRLLESKMAMRKELAAMDAAESEKKPPTRAKVIEFPGRPKNPRRAG